MCDQDHYDDDLKAYKEKAALSRRDFAALGLGAGIAFVLQRPANAVAVTEQEVKIKTPDGTCDAYFVHPATGNGAGVIMFPDIVGLRPAFRGMGKRLAESGYSVVVVNPFYRTKAAPVVPDGSKFSDPAIRSQLMPLAGSLNPTTVVTDVTAFASWLDTQKSVNTRRKLGIMGYCMSGSYTIRGAAALPNRVGAGASFHGGGLTGKDPSAPHLLIPKTNASFLFAIADNDDKRDPESKTILKQTCEAAKKDCEIEVYPAAHGWCPPDGEVYDKEQAEKAWSRMLALFGKALA
jgi:carboxymethylenebutenolidase